jgi:rhodanese-related sulfurtransferase
MSSIPKLSKVQVEKITEEPNQEYLLLDVRSREELNDIKPLPHAVNVPIDEVESAFSLPDQEFKQKYHFDKPPKDKKIVCYCKMGMRAMKGAETLKKLGYDNVMQYSGVADWYNL